MTGPPQDATQILKSPIRDGMSGWPTVRGTTQLTPDETSSGLAAFATVAADRNQAGPRSVTPATVETSSLSVSEVSVLGGALYKVHKIIDSMKVRVIPIHAGHST